jgi:hypothetical protein
MWNWYEWESLEDFNSWHEAIKAELGLPRLSIDQRGNLCSPMVEDYTNCNEVQNKFIAMVEDDYAQDLIVTQLRPPKVQSDIIS